ACRRYCVGESKNSRLFAAFGIFSSHSEKGTGGLELSVSRIKLPDDSLRCDFKASPWLASQTRLDSRPLSTPSPLRRANIPSEFLRLGLDLFETLLHDVADANDSMKCSIVNDWQMPDTLQRHHLHDIDELVLGRAGLNVTGHQLVGRKCQHRVRMLRHPADDVALGDDPNELTFLVYHRCGSDPVLGEHLNDRRDGLLRRDGHDIITFVLQDRRNLCSHVSISWLWV